MIQEVFQWNAPAPFGIPRRFTQDDEYRAWDSAIDGYVGCILRQHYLRHNRIYFPKGSMVILNLWQVLRALVLYSDA